jgi:hypothetical protein
MGHSFQTILSAGAVVVTCCVAVAALAARLQHGREHVGAVGRVRLPVRALERLAFTSLLLGAGAVAAVGTNDDGVLIGALVVGGALIALARRGTFAALESADHGGSSG